MRSNTRSTILVLAAGLLLGIVFFCGVYFWKTKEPRKAMTIPLPELGWIKAEFQLNPSQYDAISQLHMAYLPKCEEMCRRIDEHETELREMVLNAKEITPEVEEALRESARLRMECEIAMLRHFYAVSRAMPPEEGKRYLAHMEAMVFSRGAAHRHD